MAANTGVYGLPSAAPAVAGMAPYRIMTGVDVPLWPLGYPTYASTASHANTPTWGLLPVDRKLKLAAIRAECTTLEAGATVRLGVYRARDWTASKIIGELVADCGEVSGAATGIKTATCGITCAPGWYAICAAPSNHTTVRWRRYTGGTVGPPSMGWNYGYATGYAGWSATADFSAGLPMAFPALTQFSGNTDGKVLSWVEFGDATS